MTASRSVEGYKVTEEEKQLMKEHIIEAFATVDCYIDVDFIEAAWSTYQH
jgi:hypothetical protein